MYSLNIFKEFKEFMLLRAEMKRLLQINFDHFLVAYAQKPLGSSHTEVFWLAGTCIGSWRTELLLTF